MTKKEITNIFRNEKFRLPILLKKDESFIIEIKEILNNYRTEVDKIIDNVDDKITFGIIIESVIKSIKYAYEGNLSMASNEITLNLTEEIKKLPKKIYLTTDSLYRIRTNDKNYTYSKEELFHIPFENRNKVSAQRFSIPGFPCLYFGSSIYTCWEEKERPRINQIQSIKFNLKKDLELYDLSYTSYDENALKLKTKLKLKELIFSYPFILACSFIVPNAKRNDSFKPEYIFPQLLFQSIKSEYYLKEEVYGIIYSSTKIYKKNSKNKGSFDNIVIPTIKSHENGYCEKLKDSFKITNITAGWHLDFLERKNTKPTKHIIDEIDIDGTVVNYKNTKFAMFETFLYNQELNDIDY